MALLHRDHENAGKTHLVRPSKAVEHVDDLRVGQQATVTCLSIRQFNRPQQGRMKGGPVGDQPCTVGNDAKLTEIGYRAPRECGIRDDSISLLNETLPIAVIAFPKVAHP